MLTFSRWQSTHTKVVNLNELVLNLESMLRRPIGEDIEIRTHLDPGLWRVKTDPGQIEQVIINLAVNARDAMPGGSKLSIETGNVQEPERGTTFKIYLPRVEEKPDSISPPVTVAMRLRGSETILLVEDDDLVRNLRREVLESNGYKVHPAGPRGVGNP